MVQLVERAPPLSVRELENGTIPEPNVMYVTPPFCRRRRFVPASTHFTNQPQAVC